MSYSYWITWTKLTFLLYPYNVKEKATFYKTVISMDLRCYPQLATNKWFIRWHSFIWLPWPSRNQPRGWHNSTQRDTSTRCCDHFCQIIHTKSPGPLQRTLFVVCSIIASDWCEDLKQQVKYRCNHLIFIGIAMNARTLFYTNLIIEQAQLLKVPLCFLEASASATWIMFKGLGNLWKLIKHQISQHIKLWLDFSDMFI